MAKVQRVVGDQNSEEFDQLRRTVHTLMLMLESVATDLAGAADVSAINDIGTGLAAALDTGVDSAASGYTGTSLAIAGVEGTPKHPKRPSVGSLKDLDPQNL